MLIETSSPPPEYEALRALVRRAGETALDYFRRASVYRKRDGTLVTEADLAVEEILSEGLLKEWPGDGICGEEGARRAGTDGIWYVDPIDGTSAYVEGLAYWGLALARVDREGIQIGALYLPRLQELWFATRGGGAWRDGDRLPRLEERPLDRNTAIYLPSRFHAWGQLDHPGKARNVGGTAAHLCLVSGGAGAAALVPPGWQLWDVLGGLLLLEEVGGVALDMSGAPLRPLEDKREPFVAGTSLACEFLLGARGVRARNL